MTRKEQGFLLLTSQLGDPDRRPLTGPQLRTLSQRVQAMEPPAQQRELETSDFTKLGYSREMARRIIALLNDDDILTHYLHRGKRSGCIPISRLNEHYPRPVHHRLGPEAPGCLWARGDLSLLEQPGVALVGSRDIEPENLAFAREVGRQAVRQGFVLISGNARGADRAGQESCLADGGQVICVVADELERYQPRKNVLYLSEDGFDLAFSAQRALSRNRVIHSFGRYTFVAQCAYQRGGTWDGTVKNLRFSWSPVYCFRDNSPAAELLEQMGAEGIATEDLHNFNTLPSRTFGLFDQ